MSKLIKRLPGQQSLTRDEEYLNKLQQQIDIELRIIQDLRHKFEEYESDGDVDKAVATFRKINSKELNLMRKEDKLLKLREVYRDPYKSPLPYRDTKPKNTVKAICNLSALFFAGLWILIAILAIIFQLF